MEVSNEEDLLKIIPWILFATEEYKDMTMPDAIEEFKSKITFDNLRKHVFSENSENKEGDK